MNKIIHLLLLLLIGTLTYSQSSYINDIYSSPTIKEKNELFKFIIECKTNQFDSIVIMQTPLGGSNIKLNGEVINHITLFDNGQNGDLVASDSIYTRGYFSYSTTSSRTVLSQILYRYADVNFYDQGLFDSEYLDLVTVIAYYDSSLVPPANIIPVNDSIQFSEHTINIIRPSKWGDDPFPPNSYWNSTGLFTDFFCDGFYILVQNTTNNMRLGTGSGGTFGPSSNFTQGIGKSLSDLGYPFTGKMTINWTRSLIAYPKHEFLHKWAANQDLYGSTSMGLGITGFGHWAWINMNSSGLIGPTSFEFNNFNVINQDTLEVYRYGPAYWSNLELYMAGLMPIDSVPFPIIYLTDVNTISSVNARPVILTADIDTVTQSQWLSTVGPRVPSTGPDIYSVVQVVFSDELLSAVEMGYFDEGIRVSMSKELSAPTLNFYEATRGLAQIESAVIRIGSTCNDGDTCTTNDIIKSDCNCAGTFSDDDNDGICNAQDLCPGGNDSIDTNNNGIPDACDILLPLEFIGFKTIKERDGVQLIWQTASEINVDRYVIMKSPNGEQYSDIQVVLANNSIGTNTYRYVDHTPLKGTYYYRITAIDRDGSINLSKVNRISFDNERDIIVFPNPTESSISVILPPEIRALGLDIIISDISDRMLYQHRIDDDLISVIEINPFLPNGMYLITIKNIDRILHIEKLIVIP